jgi:hypothetical protein
MPSERTRYGAEEMRARALSVEHHAPYDTELAAMLRQAAADAEQWEKLKAFAANTIIAKALMAEMTRLESERP